MAANAGTPSDHEPDLAPYTRLQDWMASHGGHLHPSVQIAKDASRGVHLQVRSSESNPTNSIPKDSPIIHTPLPCTLSYFNAIDYNSNPASTDPNAVTVPSFPSHGVHLPPSFLKSIEPDDAAVFFLIGQYLVGETGFWAPYLSTLPRPEELTTAVSYEGEDLEWLGGTSLVGAREQKLRLLREKYEGLVGKLKASVEEGGGGVVDVGGYTWELYLWASSIFVSRAFSSKVLSGVIPDEDLPEESVSVLLPFIDILNHRPLAKVEWRAGKDDVVFLTLEDVPAGQEIANNYGPRNNEQLMMNYGFCLPDNPCDYRIVGLRAPPGSPLDIARTQQRQIYPDLAVETDDHYYVFNVFYPLLAPDTAMEHSIVSPALFNAISVLGANNRELETLEITESGIRIPGEAYGNSRTTLAAISQIIIELITHIVKLKTTAPDQKSPSNLKQRHAQIYRDSQITLSETALVIASWTLARARTHNFTGSWEETKALLSAHMARVPAGKFPPEVHSRVQVRILERQSLVRENGELFVLDELLGLLPDEMKLPCQTCFQQVAIRAERTLPMLRGSPEGASPFAFPMFLSYVVAVHRHAPSALPARLQKWASFLLEKYPAPPQDVLWAVEDEDDEELLSSFDEALDTMKSEHGEAAFSGLQKFTGDWRRENWWLAPNWLRWGWMTAEQESVQVPEDPLQMLGGGEEGQGQAQVMLATESSLYIAA